MNGKGNVVIVELKQWEKLTAIDGQDAIVETYTGGANRRVVHPCYQAWSYAALIRDYNEYVQDKADLKKVILFFNDVDAIESSSIRWDSLIYQRNNKNYEILMNVCYFVLDGMIQTTDKDSYKMVSFSDKHMHKLYEKFVLEYFKHHHTYLSEARVTQIKWDLSAGMEESMIHFLPIMQTDIFLRYKE